MPQPCVARVRFLTRLCRAVIIATGGFAADFATDSILAKVRPDLMALPTTNGEHCTGDGIKMALAIGAGTVDMESVQVHPTGLVHPDEPDAKVKFLAAEALRVSGLPGIGGEQASVGVGWGGQGMSEHLPACCSSRCEKEGA